MKSFIAPSYTFTPGASGVGSVNLSGISGFDVKYLVSIINQTRGEIIYSTASATLKFTNVTGTTVTLFKDTSAMNASDVLQVIYEVQSQVLPTGAATEAKQDVGNSSLSSIDTKLPAQVGGKVPVDTGLVQSLTDAQLRATPVPVSGTVTANTGLSQPLTDAQLRASSVPVSAASLPLPSGASTEAKQDVGNTSLSSIDTKTPALVSGKVPVDTGLSQPLTNTELRANPVPVSGTVSISNDRETLSVVYTTIVPFTGASIGDVVSATHIYDVSGASPTLINSIWRNETLNTTFGSAPNLSNLNISLSLTNAELRSAALSVIPNTTRGSGAVDSNTQRVVVATDDVVSTSLSSINTKTPSLDNTKQPVIPSMTTGGHLSATTDAVGTNWVAFTSQALKQLTVSNQSGTNLEFRQGGAGVGFIIPFGAMFTFFGITNANQLEVRRADVSNTQVTVTARWES